MSDETITIYCMYCSTPQYVNKILWNNGTEFTCPVCKNKRFTCGEDKSKLTNEELLDIIQYNVLKIAQCRYCVNSSHEGEGIWLDNELWICSPCVNKILKKIK